MRSVLLSSTKAASFLIAFIFFVSNAYSQCPTQTLPYTENYDVDEGCFTIINGGGGPESWFHSTSSSNLDGTGYMRVDSDADGNGVLMQETFESPIINAGTVTGTLTLEFDHYFRAVTQGSGDFVEVDVYDGTAWVNVYSATSNVGGFSSPDHQSIDITTHANANLQVRFYYDDGNSWAWYWAVDNFSIADISCSDPSSLSATNLTTTSADLSWTENGTATLWDIEWGVSGFLQGAGTTITGVSANPYNLSGLSAQTSYDFYVRSDCGASGTSSWAGPFNFNTPCAPFTAPHTESFDNPSIPSCWNQSAVTGGPWDFNGIGWNTTGCPSPPSDNTGNSGEFASMDQSGTDQDVILEGPDVDVSSLTVPQLEFYYWMCGSGYSPVNILDVEAWDGSTWQLVATVQQGTNGWEKTSYDLTTFTYGSPAKIKVRFRANSGGSFSDFYGDQALDDITIQEAPTCLAPSNQTVANLSSTGVDLGWTENGSATTWYIEYGATGFTQGAGTTVTTSTNPHSLSSLSADTEYDFHVRSFCTVGDTSLWTGPFAFRTACSPFTSPYTQNFDSETAPTVNSCWTVINTVNLARLQTDATPLGTSANSAPNAVEFYNYTSTTPTDQILVSPMFSDLDNTKRIKFFLYDYSNTSDMIIGTMSDPTNAATFSPFDTITEADMDDDVWEEFTINFTNYVGTDKYIAFAHGMNTTFDYIHLDDFTYEAIPSCPDPTSLLASNKSSSSVDLNWTESGTATSWQVSYGATGTSANAGTKLVIGTNPYTLSGLSASTAYDAHVRSICAPGDTSPWLGPVSFMTTCLAPNVLTLPYIQDFESINGTLTGDGIVSCNTIANVLFETDDQAAGRVRWGTNSFAAINGSGAVTLDRNPSSGSATRNGLVFTLDMSTYASNTDLELLFNYVDHGDENQSGDSIYIRGSSADSWVPIYFLSPASFTTAQSVGPLDLDVLLANAGQTISSTFQMRFGQEDNFPAPSDGITFDDIVVRLTPNCPIPNSLSASNITQTEADLDWTEAGTATLWDLEYGQKGFTPTGSPTVASITKPYSLSSLLGATSYEYYVRANCGGTDGTSSWVGPFSFTTPPDTAVGVTCGSGFLSVLFSEDFENNSAGWTGNLGSGNGNWEIPDGATSGGTGATSGFGGGNYMNYEASSTSNNNGSIVSPAIDLSGAVSQAELSFYMHAYGASMGTLNVGVSTSASGPFTNEFVWTGPLQTSGSDAWVNVGVDLSAYLGSTIYLQFTQYDTLNSNGSGFDGDMSIDELTVTSCVSCPAPSAFISTNITTNSIDLSWTENGTATSWLVEYGAAGFSQGSGTILSAGSNPYTLSGLSQNTAYDVYLRSYCAVGDSSTWVAPINFTTLCAAVSSFPYTQNFDALSPNNGSISCATTDLLGDCWTNEASTDDSDWIPRSSPTGSASTGPSSDHTGSGNYVFVESSTCYNKVSSLYSVEFDFSSNTAPRISFWNHMYGVTIGSLDLTYSLDNGATWSTSIFNKSGDQGDSWQQDGALILALAGESSVIFRFQAITGTNFTSDIAIDDVVVDQAPMNEVGVTSVSIAGDGCGTNQAVTIDITNFGAATQTSFPVAYELNGVTTSVNWTGSLAAGATTQYTFSSLFDASATGTYNLKAYTALVGDADNTNDTSTTSLITPAVYSTDYRADFESGLPADWTTDGSVASGHNSPSNVLFRNMYGSVPSFTSTSSRIENIAAGDVLRFAYRYSDWSAGTVGTTLGNGDTLKVLISSDCGQNFALLDTIHSGNHITSASMRLMEYDLSTYAGQTVVIRFAAERGTGDYYLDLDEIYLGEALSSNTLISSDYNGEDVSCDEASDGEAVVQAAGGVMPYTYLWDANANAQANDTASTLSAGKYFVTVTDAQGYTITDSITLSEPDTISISVNQTNPTCAQNFDGALDITVNGGTGVYSFAWSDDGAVMSEDRSAIDTGAYTVTITDINGCTFQETFTLIIEDIVQPNVITQNINAYLDATGSVTINAADVDNGSSDACGISSLALDKVSFNCADEGANSVTLTVTDVNGNAASGTATVTVIDTVSPAVNSQNINAYLDGSGNVTITSADLDNGTADACGIASLSLSTSSFTCSNVGPNTVTLTAVDNNGNSSSASATVTVVDTISPVVQLQNHTAYLDASGNVTIDSSDVENGSSDACGIQFINLSQTSFACSNVGSNTVAVTVVDFNGNSTTANTTVTVMDTVSPMAMAQDITIYLDGNGQQTIIPSDVNNGSSDACGIASVDLDTSNFGCDDIGMNPVVLTAIDINGNMDTAWATVTVIDTVSPTVTTANHTAYLDASGNVTIDVLDVSSGSSSACSIDTVIVDITSFTCADLGPNTVNVTATASGGSASSSANATVTVVDTISPTVLTQMFTTYLDASGQASIVATDVEGGSTDNCTVVGYTVDINTFDCSNLGANTVNLTVSDQSGNSSTASATVMVVDTIDPVAASRDLTVYLDASGQITITPAMANNGSSDNCLSSASLSLSQSTYDCGDEGLNQEYLIITDADGNKDSTDFLITVKDTLSPVMITKNITVQLGATGQVSIAPSQLDSASSDNCSNQLFYTASKTTFGCADLGSNTVTLTGTDVHGNSTIATSVVTVEDNLAPNVNTQSVMLTLDANGQATLTPAMVDNNSTDNCTITGFSLSQTTFTCADLGPNTVSLIATDGSTNMASANATVTVIDNMAPTAISQNITVQLDANGNATVTAMMIDNGSSDNCSVSTMSVSPSSFDCTNVGGNTVTLTVNDASGNTASTNATVTVVDNVAPVVSTRNVTVNLDASGSASITAADVNNGSADACGIGSLSVLPNSFTCADIGANTVTLTVTDVNGNVSTGTAIVMVSDNMAPTVVTTSFTAVLDANGQATIVPSDIDNGSTDNCAIASYSLDVNTFTCSALGQNAVNLTVTDGSGNSATGTAIVSVVDNMAPSVSTQNITVNLNASGQVSIQPSQINSGSTDNCNIASYSLDISTFTCADVGANTVTLTATDGSGNSSTGAATVTVVDNTSPNAVAQNITAQLDATGNATIAAASVNNGSTDACGVSSLSVSPSSFSCADLGSNSVTLTVTDNNGNSSTATATVTISDNIAPNVITQATTVYLNASGNANITAADVNNGSTDNCSVSTTSVNQTSFGCSDVGQNLVNLSVTDGSGNTGVAGAIVTVLDTISPSIANLPANITAYTTAGQCAATVNWTPITGSDNCSVSSVSTSTSSGSTFPTGLSTINVNVIDASGNSSSGSFTINVIDTLAPIFTSAATNISVAPNTTSCDATVTWTAPSATDNCSAVSYTFSQASGSTFPVGNTTVTVTASDAAGNSRTTSFVVSVTDVIAPTISSVPSNITQGNDAGSCDAAVSYTLPTVTDNCTGASITSSHASGSVFPVGTTTVNFTATDGAGNTSSASFTVTVTDNEAPVVVSTPPSDTVGQCGAAYTYPLPTGSDNCTSVVTVRQTAGLPSGSVFPSGATTNQFELTDAAGNISTTSFTIVIIPQGQPQLPSLLEICENDNAVNITLGQTIVWSGNGIVNGGTTFDPAAAGVGRHALSYVYTDAQSCDVSGSITVSVLPKPLTPIVNKIASATLSTGNYFTYQWYRDGLPIPGANAQSYTYTVSGNYQVEVTNTVGCFSYSAGFVVGQSGGGIGLFELKLSDLEVYPNPSNGEFNIALSKPGKEELTVSLYSLDGRKVYETMDRTDENGQLKLDVGHLPTANYMLYIRSNDQIEVRKILMK